MIELDRNNIKISQGDTLMLKYVLTEPLKFGDKAVFSIKQKNRNIALQAIVQGEEEELSEIEFLVSARDMEELPAGKYFYDMYIEYGNGVKFTTDWTGEFRIMPTAHEV